MKNKLITVLLMGVLTVSLSACGASDAGSTADKAEENTSVVSEETSEASEEVSTETGSDAADSGENASSQDESAASEEASGSEQGNEAEAEDYEITAPEINITGCDTFTQIIDEKLADGMGYANETIDGTDVLLICSQAYDNLDGNMASINSTVFMYKDGVPTEIGKVTSGGTAYPLSVKDGKLYAGGNHFICKYAMLDDKLAVMEKAVVTYDSDGNATYTYESDDGGDYSTMDSAEAEKIFDDLNEEIQTATVVNFSVVGGVAAADSSTGIGSLPTYEYPGPELFYTVLYSYIADEFGKDYEPAEVGIPCPIIIAEDESNRDDIKIWGDFEYYNYNLNGNTLETVSGGSYPGCIHIKSTDAGYEVTGFDAVLDGSDWEPSAKEIFGEHYDELIKAEADEEGNKTLRAQIISNYVFANNLDITAYQDYGWDPVSLPEQNIDSFYSILN